MLHLRTSPRVLLALTQTWSGGSLPTPVAFSPFCSPCSLLSHRHLLTGLHQAQVWDGRAHADLLEPIQRENHRFLGLTPACLV